MLLALFIGRVKFKSGALRHPLVFFINQAFGRWILGYASSAIDLSPVLICCAFSVPLAIMVVAADWNTRKSRLNEVNHKSAGDFQGCQAGLRALRALYGRRFPRNNA